MNSLEKSAPQDHENENLLGSSDFSEEIKSYVEHENQSVAERFPDKNQIERNIIAGDELAEQTEVVAEKSRKTQESAEAETFREKYLTLDAATLTQGITEQIGGVDVRENPAFVLEKDGFQEEDTAAIGKMAEADPTEAESMALLVDKAEDEIKKEAEQLLKLDLQNFAKNPDNNENKENPKNQAIETLMKNYEGDFHEILREKVIDALRDLAKPENKSLYELATDKCSGKFANLCEAFQIPNTVFAKNTQEEIDNWNQAASDTGDEEQNADMESSQALQKVEIAKTVNGDFQEKVADLGNQLNESFGSNFMVQHGNIKKAERITEKAEGDYGGDYNRVKDAVRARIISDGNPLEELSKIETEIRKTFPDIGDPKNSFYNKGNGRYRTFDELDGYTDMKITVPLKNEKGEEIKAEIVIGTPEMAVATVVEHPLYEIIRTINGEIKKDALNGIDFDKGDPRFQLKTLLSNVNRDFYRAVSDRFASRVE